MSQFAAIICTRNRHDALLNTLNSIGDQDLSPLPTTIVVDGSDEAIVDKNEEALAHVSSLSVVHYRYDGPPSAARQRNVGIQLLPDSAETVFFLDDDITLKPGCLHHLATALESSTGLLGVGACEISPENQEHTSSPNRSRLWKYIFLLDHPQPGRVLPSGRVSAYYSLPSTDRLVPTEWLSTCCCAYRRPVFDEIQFDNALRGALLEDRDLACRVAERGSLAAVPWAHFVHHRSPLNRRSAHQFAWKRTIQRYWFVEKNVDHLLRKAAFWWATLGQLLAALTSRNTANQQAMQGLLDGIRSILTRSHPVLR